MNAQAIDQTAAPVAEDFEARLRREAEEQEDPQN